MKHHLDGFQTPIGIEDLILNNLGVRGRVLEQNALYISPQEIGILQIPGHGSNLYLGKRIR